MYVIEIIYGIKKCWVASHNDGDPARTLKKNNAQTFKTKKEANLRVLEVKKSHPFREIIYEIKQLK